MPKYHMEFARTKETQVQNAEEAGEGIIGRGRREAEVWEEGN